MTGFFDYYESGDYLRDGQIQLEKVRTDIEKNHQLYCRIFTETLKSLKAEALF